MELKIIILVYLDKKKINKYIIKKAVNPIRFLEFYQLLIDFMGLQVSFRFYHRKIS